MALKLLVVDDEPAISRSLRDFFEEMKYEVFLAYDGEEALAQVEKMKPHLVFLDIGLPKLSGLEALPKIKEISPTTKVIMVTGLNDAQAMKEAFQKGATDYITKPFEPEYLQTTVLGKVYAQLFDDLKKEHETLLKAYDRLEQNSIQAVYSLVKALEEKHPYTKGHSERVSQYAAEIAEELGLSQVEKKILSESGLLHDIGKIGMHEAVLDKPSSLTDQEYEEVKKHPLASSEIVQIIETLKEHSRIIRHHHERWDGKGYPDGLKSEEIPLLSRILGVADTYDVMTTSGRLYHKEAKTPAQAVEELLRVKGTQLDPQVVDTFIAVLKKKGIIS